MDFTALKESNFLAKGKIRYSPIERKFIEDYLCMYVTGLFLPPTCREDIDEIINSVFPSKSKGIALLHIQKVLKINNFLPMEFREEIATQWTEVTNCIMSLNRPDLPRESFFLIQEPGMYVPKHSHTAGCSQTITFCFTLEDDSINNTEPDRKSNFTIYKEDKTEIEKSVLYPDTGKFYFEIVDNKLHDSYSDKWRFFWLYDFSNYQEVPDTIRDWQKIS